MLPIPPPFTSTALALIFEPDHPCSTYISDGSTGKLLYVVDTEVVQQPNRRTITEVRRAAGETLAQFEWRDYRADLVGFTGQEELWPSSNWLKKSSIPFKDTVTFKDEAWKGYKWKGYAPGLSLELYVESDKTCPVAKFYKPRTRPKEKETDHTRSLPATLFIDESIASSKEKLDHVVVAFLYLEKTRRERDEDDFHALPSKSHRSRKDVL
ncbi:hypothetical protein BDQ12DRAFT_734145 [Crucibulum laeve]|uniref:DUF6593 domain-containing protein n=1 Tax=Crucibulum laeve TaxID=68775 RepID=A0A5C3M8F0_9AGAR|nr:hypothetical protein BDQ12DRAFT_734145 [Crucibulum laeve]